jgi:transcriptional regulator with XRE-family HTH domain
MTLKKLAEKIGNSAMYISDIENEKTNSNLGRGLKAL